MVIQIEKEKTFFTKFVNDETYKYNGQKVELLETEEYIRQKGSRKVRFSDGKEALVYINELKN